ncbi:MAG: efflux RND transporter periplasmic adaptor subunit [Gammaproteobacteria bacterium]|nr:efflux RND transporter periplasmic adaptor subunit [Gammaproteobacteria bacterium]
MKTLIIILISMVMGGGAVFVALPYINTEALSLNSASSSADSDEKKPLYWVAPMDANYRRDGPGKSPMGMDLVPVYEEGSGGAGAGPGTISIHPSVVNNLGVRTATAEMRTLDRTITTVGYVQYDEESLVHIHPRIEGWVEKLHLKAEGDPVKKGQALYALYSPQLVTAQEEFLIALNRKNQQLISAAKDRLRALQLSDWFIQQLDKTRKVEQTVTFYAPQSGVLDRLNIREGFFVKPGTSMMSIGSLDEVWVEAEIFERQAALVDVGLPVTMTLDYKPNKRWQGKVDYIYPTLDAKTRTLRIRLRFANDDKQLKPNMFARIQINAKTDEKTLVIPSEAIIRTGSQNRVVLALDEGQFKSIAVGLGQNGDQWIEITEGLSEGDRVVTSAQFLLDSESSKTSDFVRLEAGSQPDSVWAAARVIEVMTDSAMVKLDHDPIPEWEWPQMTMMFSVADEVDIDALAAGQSLRVEINKASDRDFRITQIHIMEGMQGTHDGHQSMDHSSMDHSQRSTMPHDQRDMNNTVDHSSMDHSQHTMEASPMDSHQDQQSVDHSDHSTMDHSQHDQSGSKAVDHSKMHH